MAQAVRAHQTFSCGRRYCNVLKVFASSSWWPRWMRRSSFERAIQFGIRLTGSPVEYLILWEPLSRTSVVCPADILSSLSILQLSYSIWQFRLHHDHDCSSCLVGISSSFHHISSYASKIGQIMWLSFGAVDRQIREVAEMCETLNWQKWRRKHEAQI